MNYDSSFYIGAILGLILPTLGFQLYSIFNLDGDVFALYKQLKVMGVHSHVLSLCTLLNLIPFLRVFYCLNNILTISLQHYYHSLIIYFYLALNGTLNAMLYRLFVRLNNL